MCASATFAPDPRKRPAAAVVVKEFRDRGLEPEGFTLNTYAAFQAWAGDPTDRQRLPPWDTVLGALAFDASVLLRHQLRSDRERRRNAQEHGWQEASTCRRYR